MVSASKKPMQRSRTFKVFLDTGRNRFIAENDKGELLGVSLDINNAIGSAVREANLASREGCQVTVMVQKTNGSFKTEYIAQAYKATR